MKAKIAACIPEGNPKKAVRYMENVEDVIKIIKLYDYPQL